MMTDSISISAGNHPLQTLETLNPSQIPADSLPLCLYALECCGFAASVGGDRLHLAVASLCRNKIKEFKREIDGSVKRIDNQLLSGKALLSVSDYSPLSVVGLVTLHSMGSQWHELRRAKKMETFTRVPQWQVVNELASRNADSPLAQILMLAECLEAGNHARMLNLPYKFGDRLMPFNPAEYGCDDDLVRHIRQLSKNPAYLSREELIGIADYIQSEIVEPGYTASHLAPVSAILNTGMPSFNYPEIARALEKTTLQLAKSNSTSRMELAPAYSTLWAITLKPSYLSRFEKTLRHCYFTLAKDKTYPDLGVDTRDPRSLNAAIRFLDENRQALWILNDKYDVDKVISKYRQPLPH